LFLDLPNGNNKKSPVIILKLSALNSYQRISSFLFYQLLPLPPAATATTTATELLSISLLIG